MIDLARLCTQCSRRASIPLNARDREIRIVGTYTQFDFFEHMEFSPSRINVTFALFPILSALFPFTFTLWSGITGVPP